MKLFTERLEIRSVTPSDARDLQALFSDPEVLRYLPPFPPVTLEVAVELVERRMKREAELGYAPFVVALRGTGRFIGSAGLQPVKETPETEISYHYMPSAWGKGYATEAARAILAFAFESVGLAEVIGLVFPDNIASRRVLEKAGMGYAGLSRYFGMDGLRKYVASRATWVSPGST